MIPTATLEEADAAHALRTAAVLDVRTPDEYAAGHVPGAELMPLHLVPLRLPDLRRGERYLVVCESGARSAQATDYLLRHGYDAASVTGGMSAWRASGRHVETGVPGWAA